MIDGKFKIGSFYILIASKTEKYYIIRIIDL